MFALTYFGFGGGYCTEYYETREEAEREKTFVEERGAWNCQIEEEED